MTLTFSQTLETLTCHSCGATYALAEYYVKERRSDGKNWHCPYCDVSSVFRVSEVTRLQNELDEKQRQLTAAKCETLKEKHAKEDALDLVKKKERKLKRVTRGVCICCNRSFDNLRRHMETKHAKAINAGSAV